MAAELRLHLHPTRHELNDFCLAEVNPLTALHGGYLHAGAPSVSPPYPFETDGSSVPHRHP